MVFAAHLHRQLLLLGPAVHVAEVLEADAHLAVVEAALLRVADAHHLRGGREVGHPVAKV